MELLSSNEGRIKIHLWKSLIFAIALYAIFYGFIFAIKGLLPAIYILFYERQIFPHLSTYCSFVALLLLYFRFREFGQDFEALNRLEEHLTTVGRIGAKNADKILDDLRQDEDFADGELSYSRFSRLMQHVKSGSSWSETESLVKGMGAYDIDAVESSYVWVKFLIWFIPIIGFVGTVLGIGEAIGGFDAILTGTGGFDEMKGSLGGITNALGYAFDSTLVALMQDAFIMFILSYIQKRGDDFLVKLDEVFTDDILVRLEHVEQAGGAGLPLSDEALNVLNRFSDSAIKLEALAKLDSFEKTFVEIKDALDKLTPILANLQKKRALHFKLEEVEES